MTRTLCQQFAQDGFIVERNLLPTVEIDAYRERLRELAAGKDRWTEPDGVCRHPEFWPVIFNPRLLALVRELLGPDIKFLPHNDLHVGFSSFSWHRDNVNRVVGDGPDWDESSEPYRIVRVGIYLQSFAESHFKLGLFAGSHRQEAVAEAGRGMLAKLRTTALASLVSGLTNVEILHTDADWVATQPGDCVIFDPRVLHTGSKIDGRKYSLFVAYGVENGHFRDHWHYYVNMRRDLGYSGVSPELAERLRSANLLAAPPDEDHHVAAAWMPTPTYSYVAKHFK